MLKLADNLRKGRTQRNMTQQDVANHLGINIRTYQYYEGGREPDLETLVAIADLFDVSLDELVGRERK